MSETVVEEQEPLFEDEQPAEAEEVEEEGSDPGEEESPAEEAFEGQPEEQQPAGLSIEELERVRGKLDRSATTWRNRVSELLGEEALMLVPCELCDPLLPGFHFPPDLEQPRDDVHAALLEVLKQPARPSYNDAQTVRRCAACDGWGVVLSGSRKAGKDVIKCATCDGNGFQGPANVVAAAPPQNGEVEVEFPDSTNPLVSDGSDPWGSPKILPDGQENPNWGRMPQFKIPTLP